MKNEYCLSKHRFYELKHFCLQYQEWKALYSQLNGWPEKIEQSEGDTTSRDGIRRADLRTKIDLVRSTAHDVCNDYEQDIFIYVTSGIKPKLHPAQADFWYYYRKFFWELSQRRT